MKKSLLWMAIAFSLFRMIPFLCFPPPGIKSPLHDAIKNRLGGYEGHISYLFSLLSELLLCMLLMAILSTLRKEQKQGATNCKSKA